MPKTKSPMRARRKAKKNKALQIIKEFGGEVEIKELIKAIQELHFQKIRHPLAISQKMNELDIKLNKEWSPKIVQKLLYVMRWKEQVIDFERKKMHKIKTHDLSPEKRMIKDSNRLSPCIIIEGKEMADKYSNYCELSR